MDLAGKVVAVIGMERSGLGAVKLLRERGAHVVPIDSGKRGEVEGIPIQGQTAQALAGVQAVVLSPGVPFDLDLLAPLRAGNVPVIGELGLAARFLRGDIIGITGTNGKTTTTALTGHLLREAGVPSQVGGNIGTAASSLVETSRPGQWNVLELSSFQLEAAGTFRAELAAILNLTQNHLDRHHTFADYVEAKARLLDGQESSDTAVLNAGDPDTVRLAGRARGKILWFSASGDLRRDASLQGSTLYLGGRPLLDVRDLQLRGVHNYENVMAAALLAHEAGASPEKIARAAATFQPIEHRLELVRTVNGVAYYNDSKATSVDATLKAIDAFSGGLWIILGGRDKDSDFRLFREPLRDKGRAALLIGEAASKLATQLDGSVPVRQSGDLETALETARAEAAPGDTVLLAPACASYDQFKNFEHRGQVFKELVSHLKEER